LVQIFKLKAMGLKRVNSEEKIKKNETGAVSTQITEKLWRFWRGGKKVSGVEQKFVTPRREARDILSTKGEEDRKGERKRGKLIGSGGVVIKARTSRVWEKRVTDPLNEKQKRKEGEKEKEKDLL